MRLVGNLDRSEIELNPQEAWRRARQLDAMSVRLRPAYPRGVTRATHAEFQRIDDARMVEAARRVSGP